MVVKRRLKRKRERAKAAYVNERQSKHPVNCVNGGRELSGKTHVCKIAIMGTHEMGAGQCWAEKAQHCPFFEARSAGLIKAEFDRLPDLHLRYPSINELEWIEAQIQAELKDREKNKCQVSVSEESSTGIKNPAGVG